MASAGKFESLPIQNRRELSARDSRSFSTGFAESHGQSFRICASAASLSCCAICARRLAAHLVILTAVVAAVACSVGTQYGVKNLVDQLSAGPSHAGGVWLAFVFLMSLIAADNFLWRIASWTASFTFVGVTGDLRRDMFRHLTGHAPSYFSDRLPGMLTSRITATSNAVFTVKICWSGMCCRRASPLLQRSP